MQGRLRYVREAGFDVTVACSPGREAELVSLDEGVTLVSVPIERGIAPLRDLASLWRLRRLVRRLRPDICHVATPKAGLLGGLAAWMAGVPCRVYTLYGLRLETVRGWRRALLACTEWLACRLAQCVVCVSPSLQQAALRLGLLPSEKVVLLASGSANGVDAGLFAPSPERLAAARQAREQLGIPQMAPVVGFVGRVTADKGVGALVAAYQALRDAYPDLHLLLLGPLEPIDPLPAQVRQDIAGDPRIIHLGFIPDPAVFYHVMDVLALPSHREGFPTVALEAAAAAKPVVATAATGLVDAVVNGVTGTLTPVGDASALARALAYLLDHPEVAQKLGQAGRERAGRYFGQAPLWQATVDLYELMLRAPTVAAPCPSIHSLGTAS